MDKEPYVIAETDELLVINKPAGLIVHSDGRTQESTLVDWLLAKFPMLDGVGESWVSPQGEVIPLPGIVHRLDRTTSGVMLVAKTNEAYASLKSAFKERRIEKTYRALVYGSVEKDEGRIVAEIMRSKDVPRRWYARPCDEADTRAAITNWRVIDRFETEGEAVSYLELKPVTGRTHQLRVHLASIDHPILADHVYASERKSLLAFKRPALHAHSLSLVLNGERETYVAPMPEDFVSAVSQE